MFRSWIKILPYFVVSKLAKHLCVAVRVQPKETFILYEVFDGEYILISEEKYRQIKNREKEKRKKKREKKLNKAREKLNKLLSEYPELHEDLKSMLK